MIYVFGQHVLDTQLYELRDRGVAIPLGPKVFSVLAYLVCQRHRVVTKQELLTHVWSDLFVSEAALVRCVTAARRALGDDGETQEIIKTVYGRGYRFVAVVEEHADVAEASRPSPPPLVATPEATVAPSEAFAPAPESLPMAPAAASSESLVNEDAAAWEGLGLVAHSGELAEEHKQVTALACVVSQSALLMQRLAPTAFDDLLQEFFMLAVREIQRYEGIIQRYLDDGLVALFGVPVAHEDHARRAFLAALGIQRRLRAQRLDLRTSADESLDVHIGLHTGPVVGRRLEHDRRTTYVALGDTIRLATRLQQLAAPDTILASNTTMQLLQGMVRADTWGEVTETGQQPAPLAYRVQPIRRRRAAAMAQGAQTVTPFVGRANELAMLYALLAQVEVGRGQVVGIMGEPGIGKSRLVREFRSRLRPKAVTYLHGQCVSYGQTTPYLPLLDLLRQACGLHEGDSGEAMIAKVQRSLLRAQMSPEVHAPYLLHLLGLTQDASLLAELRPPVIRQRTFDALLQLCLRGSRERPLILEIENLHWIDATSDECLTALTQRLDHVPILLLATYRPGFSPSWVGKSYATQLALPRLSSQDSRHVVQTALHALEAPESLVRTILHYADGNPFFLEELTRTILERGDMRPTVRVPATIHAVLAARIDRLPSDAKRILQTAAILGKDVSGQLLAALAGLSEPMLHPHLQQLQDAEMLYETPCVTGTSYTFKHALTQEVAYHSLPRRTRQRYHKQVTQLLASQPGVRDMQPELLAYHYTEAGLREQALTYWQQAGLLASRRSAHVEAIAHLSNGIALLQSLPETPARVRQELLLQTSLSASLLITRGNGALEVEQAYIRARTLCQQVGDDAQLSRVFLALCGFYVNRADFQRAHAHATQLLALAEQGMDTTVRVVARHAMGFTLFFLGEFAAAHAHLEHAIALDVEQRRADGAPPALAARIATYCYDSFILWLLGYPEQALQRSTEAVLLARTHGRPFHRAFAFTFAAACHQFRREWQAAQHFLDEALPLSAEQAFMNWYTLGTVLRGWTCVAQDQGLEGITQMQQGMAAWRAVGSEAVRPYFLAYLAEGYGRVGQPAEGLAVLTEALGLTEKSGECFHQAELYRLQGELLLMQDAANTSAAADCFQRALAVARRQQARSLELRAAMSLCGLWQRQGQRHEAYTLLHAVYALFTEGFETVDLQEAEALLVTLRAEGGA